MLGDQADLWVYVPVWLSKRVLICPIMATQRIAPHEVCKTFEPMSLETKAFCQHAFVQKKMYHVFLQASN